ncbi:MAG: DUF7309 domain-containing protein [Verrucomicrobiota bacterium]
MAHEDNTLPVDLAQQLVAQAHRLKELAPWEWTERKLIFAVEDTATGWPVAVSIPGEREDVLGISFYVGVNGIDFLVRLANDFYGEDEGRDAMMRLHSYHVEFDEGRYLEREDRRLLESLGEKIAEREACNPVFRAAAPGELPWACEGDDARALVRLLRSCAEALESVAAAPELIDFDYLGLPRKEDDDVLKGMDEEITTDKVVDFMHANAMDLDLAVGDELHEQVIEDFPLWNEVDGFKAFRRQRFEVREPPLPRIEFEAHTEETLRRLMEEPGRGTWEIGRRLGVPVGEAHSRYHHTEILAIRHQTDGRILAAEVGKVSHRPRLLARMLKRTIFEEDTLPAKLRADDEELLVLLDGFGLEFGVAIEGDECPQLDQQLDELVQRMLGG